MKREMILPYAMALGAMTDLEDTVIDDNPVHRHRKIPLTNKQKKVRSAAKRAKQARRQNR